MNTINAIAIILLFIWFMSRLEKLIQEVYEKLKDGQYAIMCRVNETLDAALGEKKPKTTRGKKTSKSAV